MVMGMYCTIHIRTCSIDTYPYIPCTGICTSTYGYRKSKHLVVSVIFICTLADCTVLVQYT